MKSEKIFVSDGSTATVEKIVRREFVFIGFRQDGAFRVFGFRVTSADRTQTVYAVRTDLALAQKYGIRLQELPLLCREVLEHVDETEQRRAFTYTEADMCQRADKRAAQQEAADLKKKTPRRPASTNVGAAWRVPPPR